MILPDEIAFWSRQLSEHALFLHLGLEKKTLKREALLLHNEWELFRAGQPSDLLGMCSDLRAFKTLVLDELQKGWCGWIYPLFVEHTRRELDMFVKHIQTNALDEDELQHWLRFMAEHAAFAAHLLDPMEADKIREATEVTGQFCNLAKACDGMTPTLLDMSKHEGEGLDEWLTQSGLGTPNTRSVVHPALAAHVVREGQRFLQTVDALGQGVK